MASSATALARMEFKASDPGHFTVVVDPQDGGPLGKWWHMIFTRILGDEEFEFRVDGPDAIPLSAWRDVAAGRGHLRFLKSNVRQLSFIGEPRGDGDGYSIQRVPLGAVAPQLNAALDAAVAAGLKFGKE